MSEHGSTPESYTFDDETQDDILRLMVQDHNFVDAAQQWVRPKYFAGMGRRVIASKVLEFYERYGMIPRRGQLLDEIRKQYPPESKTWGEIERLLPSILDDIPSSKEYTVDVVSSFAKAQAYREAFVDSLPLLKTGGFEQIDQKFQQASSIVTSDDAGGYWYFEAADERCRRRAMDESPDWVLPTGILEVDDLLRYGGLSPGEIGLIIAPTNGGKSIALSHFLRRGIWEGARVAFFSFEMSDEKNADRLDAGFTATDMWNLRPHNDHVHQELRKLAVKFPKRLWIKRYPTKGATIADMRRALDTLERRERWRPNLIVMDYAAIVKPMVARDQRHLEIQEILEEFRGLCVEKGAVGWTAAQTNKKGATAKLVKGTHVASSWDSLGICDYIFTITLTDEMREDNELKLYVDKNRDGVAKIQIGPLYTDWAKMCFVRRTNAMPRDFERAKKAAEE